MAISGDFMVSAALNPYKFNPLRTSTQFSNIGENLKSKIDLPMAISGDFMVSAALNPYKFNPLRTSTQFPPNKVDFNAFVSGSPGISCSAALEGHTTICCNYKRRLGIFGDYKLSQNSINLEEESFLLNAIKLNFLERLNLAWKIIFPSPPSRKNSNARIAKQRLKMILFSDRCAVSDEAKQKIVSSILTVLSDFVEIESQDKVQLSVSTDADVGTIYSVTVPVRRVRSEYQINVETDSITNIQYRDTGSSSGSVDVTFDFHVPGDEFKD